MLAEQNEIWPGGEVSGQGGSTTSAWPAAARVLQCVLWPLVDRGNGRLKSWRGPTPHPAPGRQSRHLRMALERAARTCDPSAPPSRCVAIAAKVAPWQPRPPLTGFTTRKRRPILGRTTRPRRPDRRLRSKGGEALPTGRHRADHQNLQQVSDFIRRWAPRRLGCKFGSGAVQQLCH